MAKFNRDFLVPYLQDVCATELQINKLTQCISSTQNEIKQIQHNNYYPKPVKKTYTPRRLTGEDIGTMVFASCAGTIILLILSVIFKWIKSPTSLLLLLCPAPLIIIGYLWVSHSEKREAEEQNEADYQNELQYYKQSLVAQKQAQPHIALLNRQLSCLKDELEDVRQLRSKLYDVNVIPMQYRNIYVAVYLHQFVSTSQANDIDIILQTFILEEIKAKLDDIISLQSESILNQEMIMANQRATLESQERHQSYMENKARQVAASQEEQAVYLSMIKANTSASAYFSAANYYARV